MTVPGIPEEATIQVLLYRVIIMYIFVIEIDPSIP